MLRKKQLPFELPEAKNRSERGQYRSVAARIPRADPADTVTVECWVPTSVSATELARLLAPSAALEKVYKRLDRTKAYPESLFREPRSREYQQLKHELLAANPGPLPINRFPSGASLTDVACTTNGWPSDPGGQTYLCVECETYISYGPAGLTGVWVTCKVTHQGSTYRVAFPSRTGGEEEWFVDPDWLTSSVYEDEEALSVYITPSSFAAGEGELVRFAVVTNGTVISWQYMTTAGPLIPTYCGQSEVCVIPVTQAGTMTVSVAPKGTFQVQQTSSATVTMFPCDQMVFNWNKCHRPLSLNDSLRLHNGLKSTTRNPSLSGAAATACDNLFAAAHQSFSTREAFSKIRLGVKEHDPTDHLAESFNGVVHIDSAYFWTAPTKVLVNTFLHEQAHLLGYPNHPPTRPFMDPPWSYLNSARTGASGSPSNYSDMYLDGAIQCIAP